MTFMNPTEALLETLHILVWLIPSLADWITICQFCFGYLGNPARITMGHIATTAAKIDRQITLLELLWSVDKRVFFSLMGRGLRRYLRFSAGFRRASAHKEHNPPGPLA